MAQSRGRLVPRVNQSVDGERAKKSLVYKASDHALAAWASKLERHPEERTELVGVVTKEDLS